MKNALIHIVLLAASVLAPRAQSTLVVPPTYENRRGVIGGVGGQVQYIIEASAMPAIPPAGVWITGLAFRYPLHTTEGGAVYGKFDVTLSTTPKNLDQLTVPPRSNIGSDAVLVVSGPRTFPLVAWGGQSIRPFEGKIPFDKPFFYQPTASLLLDFQTEWLGVGDPRIDFIDVGIPSTGLFGIGSTGVIRQPGGYIMELQYSPVPEPGVCAVLALGCVLLVVRSRCGGES
jgi:hypothetical protein